jgi:hypothetical protein
VITALVFHHGVTDHGLHSLGLVLIGAGAVVLLLTVLDRQLMGRGTGRASGTAAAPIPPPPRRKPTHPREHHA